MTTEQQQKGADRADLLARLMEAQNEAQRLAIQLLQHDEIERRGPQPAQSATGRGPVLVEKAG